MSICFKTVVLSTFVSTVCAVSITTLVNQNTTIAPTSTSPQNQDNVTQLRTELTQTQAYLKETEHALAQSQRELRAISEKISREDLRKKTQREFDEKIAKQEELVETCRQRLLEFSKKTGIIYFDLKSNTSSSTSEPAHRVTAVEYTKFNTLVKNYETELSMLKTLKNSKLVNELSRRSL